MSTFPRRAWFSRVLRMNGPPRGYPGRDEPRLGFQLRPGVDLEWLVSRVSACCRARHLSPKTEKTYLSWIRRYLAYNGMIHPKKLGLDHLDQYLEHLAMERGLGADSQNQAASAILFMYRQVWGIDHGGLAGVRRAKEPKVLPRHAAPEEIDAVMRRLGGTARVAAIVMYGSGTRIAETVALRLKDVSLAHRELSVRSGKGAKDRVTIIPRAAVPVLREQMEQVERRHIRDLEAGHGWARLPGALHRKDPSAGWELGWQFLFPSGRLSVDPKTRQAGRLPVHHSTIQRAVKKAVRESGVTKTITCHVFRHCFATELLRAGVDVRMLQKLMGHKDLKTTARYLHITDRPGPNIESPLDRLPSMKEQVEAYHRDDHPDLGVRR